MGNLVSLIPARAQPNGGVCGPRHVGGEDLPSGINPWSGVIIFGWIWVETCAFFPLQNAFPTLVIHYDRHGVVDE